MIRKIGHEILLHSGDSTSRVLPVKRLAENEYQIQFEKEFIFDPNFLVQIVKKVVSENKLSPEYVVSVMDCLNKEVVFGYTISGNGQKNVIPCIGRIQKKKCYFINLKFRAQGVIFKTESKVLSILAVLIILVLSVKYYRRKSLADNQVKQIDIPEDGIRIGKYNFFYEKQYLTVDQVKTDLTIKEAKLLHIFAASPNQIIDRNRLQKEVWEDDGVIVGRSLDIFISKLRKKLEYDPTVRIVNIHGKGYKLEINS
ncbi:response regulator transcription factor [Pedobacter frigoris]|uniref:Response regulator transcription factor n=1 Tax=Pedobacter frigoris TaxID=2571272 RepID=A0A4U1CLF3_9SPHI|nr:response regulator transcription factor [Pedobacter frigoris]